MDKSCEYQDGNITGSEFEKPVRQLKLHFPKKKSLLGSQEEVLREILEEGGREIGHLLGFAPNDRAGEEKN